VFEPGESSRKNPSFSGFGFMLNSPFSDETLIIDIRRVETASVANQPNVSAGRRPDDPDGSVEWAHTGREMKTGTQRRYVPDELLGRSNCICTWGRFLRISKI